MTEKKLEEWKSFANSKIPNHLDLVPNFAKVSGGYNKKTKKSKKHRLGSRGGMPLNAVEKSVLQNRYGFDETLQLKNGKFVNGVFVGMDKTARWLSLIEKSKKEESK